MSTCCHGVVQCGECFPALNRRLTELGELGELRQKKLEAEREVSKELGELLELAEERHQLWLRERAILQRRLRHQRGELAAQSRSNDALRQELGNERRGNRTLLDQVAQLRAQLGQSRGEP